MASRGTLIALSVIAAALAAVVSLGGRRPTETARTSPRLVPELGRADVARLVIRRQGEADVELRRRAGGAYELAHSPTAALDAVAVEDLLANLELLSHRRRLSAGSSESEQAERGFDPPRLVVEIELTSGASVELRVGNRIAAADQTWIRRSDDPTSYLIPGYAARGLDRRVEDLRSRRPFRVKGVDVTGIELHEGERSLVLGGRPMAVHLDGGGSVRAVPGGVAELLRLLEDLRVRRFVDAPEPASPARGLVVRVVGALPTQELEEMGPCPGQAEATLVSTSVGAGCVDDAALRAIAAHAGKRSELYDRRLIGDDALEEISVEGDDAPTRLARSGRRWQLVTNGSDSGAADSAAVREWLDALDQLAVGEHPPSSARAEPEPQILGAISLAYADGRRVRLELRQGRGSRRAKSLAVRRGEEPVQWLVGAVARDLFNPGVDRFRQRQLLSLEPFALRSARRWSRAEPAEHVERGELLEEWHARAPEQASVRMPAIEALREAASSLRAVRFTTQPAGRAQGLKPPRARVEVVFDPPPVASRSALGPTRYSVEIGKATEEGGCLARLDADPAVFELPGDQCAALLGPWTVAKP